jgi:hypothetical protein
MGLHLLSPVLVKWTVVGMVFVGLFGVEVHLGLSVFFGIDGLEVLVFFAPGTLEERGLGLQYLLYFYRFNSLFAV